MPRRRARHARDAARVGRLPAVVPRRVRPPAPRRGAALVRGLGDRRRWRDDDAPTPRRTASEDRGPPLFVDGDLDLFGAPTLRAAIAERLEAGATTIVVDLSACGFIDSVGLSLLLTTRERCRAAGGGLSVIGAGENALRLFETVGVRELLVQP